nr:response regulator [Methanolinea mesophila]
MYGSAHCASILSLRRRELPFPVGTLFSPLPLQESHRPGSRRFAGLEQKSFIRSHGIFFHCLEGRGHVIAVLYVDDELQLLEMARVYLERSGEFSLHTASSVKSAIAMLEGHRYDAIISDYQLPGPTGIDLLRHIRKTDEHIPFLLFTGRGREEVVIEALNCGADFYIEKGTDVVTQFLQLEHEIREAVRRRRAEEARVEMEAMLHITNAAVRSAQNPILITDLEGNLIFVNPAYLETFAYTEEREVLGKPVTDFFASPEMADVVVGELLRTKAWAGEVVARKNGGDTFDARVVANEISDESGRVLGYVASCTDLTEQKLAFTRLEEYARLLKQASTAATELAEYPLDANIYQCIAESLQSLVPPGSVVFVSSVCRTPDRTVILLEAFQGISSRETIESIIGRPLAGLAMPVNEEHLSSLAKGSFHTINGGVRDITFGLLLPGPCRALEAVLPGGCFLGAGFTWKGQVKGSTAVLLPVGASFPYLDILDLFIRQAAAVLQRREAESELYAGNPEIIHGSRPASLHTGIHDR